MTELVTDNTEAEAVDPREVLAQRQQQRTAAKFAVMDAKAAIAAAKAALVDAKASHGEAVHQYRLAKQGVYGAEKALRAALTADEQADA